MKRLFISAAAFCVIGSVSAQERTLTTYGTLSDPNYIDVGAEGLSVGDMYVRRGDVSFSQGGDVVGEYYTQATIVYLDKDGKVSARSFFKEYILPGGSIYKMDFVQTKDGNAVDNKHVHDGAIIGGTGDYAGIRGSYTLEVLPSGKEATSVLTYWIGQ